MTSIGSTGYEAVGPPPDTPGDGPPASSREPAVAGVAAAGVVASFDDFAARERTALVAFAWSLTGDRGAAEDIVQDALTTAWRDWSRIGAYDKPGAWARRVVANRVTDRGRRRGRESLALRRLHQRPSDEVVLEPADAEFWGALRTLPARQAQTLALHYLEDRPLAEIATILEMAEGTVKSHMHRGRQALARHLGLTHEEDAR